MIGVGPVFGALTMVPVVWAIGAYAEVSHPGAADRASGGRKPTSAAEHPAKGLSW